MEIVTWIQAHWLDIINVYLAAVGLASVIVKLTPTQVDDNILAKITSFVGKFVALNK